jgi:hypothetical protein
MPMPGDSKYPMYIWYCPRYTDMQPLALPTAFCCLLVIAVMKIGGNRRLYAHLTLTDLHHHTYSMRSQQVHKTKYHCWRHTSCHTLLLHTQAVTGARVPAWRCDATGAAGMERGGRAAPMWPHQQQGATQHAGMHAHVAGYARAPRSRRFPRRRSAAV